MDELNKIAALFIGAGPASLAGAIKLKQLLKQKGRNDAVVVIEKADKLGQHNLSGAVFEADVLDDLIPGWKEKKDAFVTRTLANEVKRDETVFLPNASRAIRLPETIVPKYMHHHGNYVLSLSEMVNWLAGIARELGVEIYTGFAAKELVVADSSVKGIKLGDKGLDKDGGKQANYSAGEIIEAQVTVLGEGSLGQLSEGLVRRGVLGKGKNPPSHAVGVKELIRLPEQNSFGANHVLHTFGFPNPTDVYGGGTLYSLGKDLVAVALLLALDWRYCDLNPQRELQTFKSHKFISGLLEGGEVISYGARTLPEGGYYARPELAASGALVIGDAAGLTSVRKLKGLHYAIKSGMIAGETIFQAIEQQDFSRDSLKRYEEQLAKSFVMKDLYHARNYRQVFNKAGRAGVYLGAPASLAQQWLPFRLGTKPDYEGMRSARLDRRYNGGIDRLTAVSLSGTTHREDEPCHITFSNPTECASCKEKFGCHPCESFCPGEVYRFEEDTLILSPSNCLHCQTCRIKCPNQIIQWTVPEGGDGPRYKLM
ncbi:MAG: 4Fe-4S dicluster domain-containing protein [Chloroflexi bacterium]|nr:4Fe-4S dicluster domain-containing protein [Chloroflexota bacterium]